MQVRQSCPYPAGWVPAARKTTDRMTHLADSVREHDTVTTGRFHKTLVAFDAPQHMPVWTIYLAVTLFSALLGWFWLDRGSPFQYALIVFAVQLSFFGTDRSLLSSLPSRGLSFGPWQSQIAALTLPRFLVALAAGFIIPIVGWRVAFYLHLGVQFLGTVLLYRGAVIEPGRLSQTELSVRSDHLPPGSTPLRILHISDLHIERIGLRERRVLEIARAAKPDLVLLTGDYVNLSFNTDRDTHLQVRELLEELCAPMGVFAILGSPPVDLPDVIPPLFADLQVRLLRNEAVTLTGRDGQKLTLLGIDCRHDIAGDGATLNAALARTAVQGPVMLLYHSPELMLQAIESGVDLYLCGHTHGGQVRLPLIGPLVTSSRLGRRYVMGHYHEGRTHLYVSRGIGFEGLGAPRIRLLCPPELTLITLNPAES